MSQTVFWVLDNGTISPDNDYGYNKSIAPNGSEASVGTNASKWNEGHFKYLEVELGVLSDFIPNTDNQKLLGSPSKIWKESHVGYIKVYGDADIQGYLQVGTSLSAASLGITGGGTFGGSINCANVNATGNIDGYNIHAANNLSCAGTLTTGGGATVNGLLTVTASANIATNLSIGGQILSSLIPQSATNNLGSVDNKWGTAFVQNVSIDQTLTLSGYTFPSSDGQSGQVLSTNGNGTLNWASVLSLPGSFTNNCAARLKSPGSIAGSGIIIDDADNISGVAALNAANISAIGVLTLSDGRITGSPKPTTPNGYSLGTADYRWGIAFLDQLNASGNAVFGANVQCANLTLNGPVKSNLLPDAGQRELGSPSYRWNKGWYREINATVKATLQNLDSVGEMNQMGKLNLYGDLWVQGDVLSSLKPSWTFDLGAADKRWGRFFGKGLNVELNEDAIIAGNNQTSRTITLGQRATYEDKVKVDCRLEVIGPAVFNENGLDVDFRIESGANANMFFLDASEGRIGIGTGSPSVTLDLIGDFKVSGSVTIGSIYSQNDFRIAGYSGYDNLVYVSGSQNKVYVGAGATFPNFAHGRMNIWQIDYSGQLPLVSFMQKAAVQPFFTFDGIEEADDSGNICTLAGTGDVVGPRAPTAQTPGWLAPVMVRAEVGGEEGWIAFYKYSPPLGE